MATPLIETLQGVVNGTNTLFFTSYWYIPGSTQVWIDGQMVVAVNDDGWKEEGQNRIRLKQAPIAGQVPQVFYRAI